MRWKEPPVIKIYEALGCIADGRIEMGVDFAKVFSSSGGKAYDVRYSFADNAIMSNDNGSYYAGYLGYPAIAFLMKKGELEFSTEYSEGLKGIKWKDINTEFHNDFALTQKHVENIMKERGADLKEFHCFLDRVMQQIKTRKIKPLGVRQAPPAGY